MNSKYDYDIIRDYLHGLVDQETARRIRNLIREDEVARNIAAGILQLEHEFNGNEEEIESYIEGLRMKQLKLVNVQGRSRHIRAWTKIAAALVVIVAASAIVWYTTRNVDLVREELRKPYPLAVVDRSSGAANEGFEFYQKGKYLQAIAAFEQVTDNPSVTFYNGVSNLYVGYYSRAVELLSTTSLQESRYKDQADWYRTLALLKAGRLGEAERNLRIIAESPEHYKSDVAKELHADLY